MPKQSLCLEDAIAPLKERLAAIDLERPKLVNAIAVLEELADGPSTNGKAPGKSPGGGSRPPKGTKRVAKQKAAARSQVGGPTAAQLEKAGKMWEAGKPVVEVADVLGVKASAVYYQAKKHGWDRPKGF